MTASLSLSSMTDSAVTHSTLSVWWRSGYSPLPLVSSLPEEWLLVVDSGRSRETEADTEPDTECGGVAHDRDNVSGDIFYASEPGDEQDSTVLERNKLSHVPHNEHVTVHKQTQRTLSDGEAARKGALRNVHCMHYDDLIPLRRKSKR